MDLVAGIIERAREDIKAKSARPRVDERVCPIHSPSEHPIEDCALPIVREAVEFASIANGDASEIALHIMGYIQRGI
jgi:hypothetical protein